MNTNGIGRMANGLNKGRLVDKMDLSSSWPNIYEFLDNRMWAACNGYRRSW